MLISYNTLKKLIDFSESPEEISALLTSTGLEVESVKEALPVPGGLKGLVLGEVITCENHPNADKLKCTTVAIGGEEPLNIVCGAPNVAVGQKVVVATVGTTLYPKDGQPFEIKKSKIRGELSEGMLCAEDEIGLGQSHDGILVLNTDLLIGTPAATYFKLETDYVIEIGLTPNRADGASHYGVARDIKALKGTEVVLPDVSTFTLEKSKASIHLKVEDLEGCPRFCGLEIRNVKVQASPEWLKQFLGSIGVNSINNLVDISNYICHFLGQPMHIFDADKIAGNQIIVRTPEKDTIVKTLDGLDRKLSGSDLAICDTNEPLGIAGVFGGEKSGVSLNTKNVFLEVAYFNPDRIRNTATAHSIKTDASFRYERGTDPNMPLYAIKLAALLVQELGGGELVDTLYDNYPVEIIHHNVLVKFKNIDRLIGKNLPHDLIKNILHKLDINVLSESEEGLELSVPPYRVDVTREADVVEEILRIYGFDNIELSAHLSSDYLSDFKELVPETQQIKVSELLAANGFHEIQTLSIVKPAQNSILADIAESKVTLMNPLNEDLSEMRNSLMFSGLQTLTYNINRRNKDLKVFEFGRTYGKKESENGTKYFDEQKLGIWLTGNLSAESWQQKNRPVSFFDLKNEVAKVMASMRMTNLSSHESSESLFEYGLDYQLNNRAIATLGKVKASHLKFADIKQEVYYAEVDWLYVLKKYTFKVGYREISKFPEVRRDLSLVIDKKISFSEIKEIALKTDKKLLKQVNVFDIYEGEKLGAGKKSYSVSFILQDNDKTLSDKEIEKTMNKLIAIFETQLSAEIRR